MSCLHPIPNSTYHFSIPRNRQFATKNARLQSPPKKKTQIQPALALANHGVELQTKIRFSTINTFLLHQRAPFFRSRKNNTPKLNRRKQVGRRLSRKTARFFLESFRRHWHSGHLQFWGRVNNHEKCMRSSSHFTINYTKLESKFDAAVYFFRKVPPQWFRQIRISHKDGWKKLEYLSTHKGCQSPIWGGLLVFVDTHQ